ncbi:MAG: carbohydrate-selective porin, OprB family [Caudoviricetes sp.]|nr:MAG: carbohydrate-selective porin, OprB family [Caudoviricetes sp.]
MSKILKFILSLFILYIISIKNSWAKTLNVENCKSCIDINVTDSNEYWNVHNSYIGQTIISLNIKKDLIKIGGLYASYDNNRGNTITNNYVGSFNSISSIENNNTNKLYELYYYNTYKNIFFKVGKFDLQSDFGSDESFSYFINTSSTSSSIFSNNTYEMSNYGPVSSLGIYSEFNIFHNILLKAAIVSDNPFKVNTDISTSKNDIYGNTFKIESPLFLLQLDMVYGNKNKTYISIGGFYDLGKQSITYSNNIHKTNASFYISITKDLFYTKKYNLQFMVRYMNDPYTSRSVISSTFDTGLLYTSNKNIIGIIFGYEKGDKNLFVNKSKLEYRFELTYRYNITDNFFIQPDIQYIFNLSGTSKNMFLIGIRETLNY